ncbi:MAG: hypothetical protein L0332_27690 [Chloroflexi bacterium]|nr:hypothetical protein [Chloroflexota bacterium]MCI0650034.1 hypothetical protein [Chloroflexota bacterium]MCI0730482.1 hypothetical protein [Chloroflexota bacterium]
MSEKQLSPINNWQARIQELRELLEEASNELIEAETGLAERLAAVNAFDFKLRSRLGQLTARLEALEEEILNYRQQLRRLQDDWGQPEELEEEWAAGDGGPRQWRFYGDEGQARSKYHPPGKAKEPPARPLSADQKATLRQLYRQLARRFHPDLAVDEADRQYRTAMMAAVNEAYAAADVERLRALLQEPDAGRLESARTDEQLVEALENELARCRSRLQEIKRELAELMSRQSSRLLRQAQKAEAEGRDLLAELASQLKAEIGRKMVERDVLKSEVEEFSAERGSYASDRLADAIYHLGLEFVDEGDLPPEVNEWIEKRRNPYEWDEDNPGED